MAKQDLNVWIPQSIVPVQVGLGSRLQDSPFRHHHARHECRAVDLLQERTTHLSQPSPGHSGLGYCRPVKCACPLLKKPGSGCRRMN